MFEDLDYEDIFKIGGYEFAIRYLIQQTLQSLKAGVDPNVALIRFHIKATHLKTLQVKDRRTENEIGGQDGRKKRKKEKAS